MIRVTDVHFGYRPEQPVLRGVSFDVAPGELLMIAGPNGSGKSTLLGLLDGLIVPTSGLVLFDGRPLTSFSRREVARTIGYISQTVDIHFPLTSLEYVLQGRFAHGSLLGFESGDDLAAARDAMRLTGTGEFESRHIDELSGGERQRVCLARALAQQPRALLLDEPTANLDIQHQVRALGLVRRLARERGIAAVVITHELNLAAEFADRILLLGDGRTVATGTPHEVLTEAYVSSLFQTPVLVDENPASGAPRITILIEAPDRAGRGSRDEAR